VGNKKIKLEIYGLSLSQSQLQSFALVLGEADGNRRLPIIIGMFEAQAIAIEIEKITAKRPMTHDLFKSFAQSFNFSVDEILISDIKEGVFFAKIICSDNTRKIEIDARPSDGIAIGIRFDAPIYTYEKILAEAGVILDEDDDPKFNVDEDQIIQEKKASQIAEENYKDLSDKDLNALLKSCLEKEDYEKAAKIRDQLKKRK